MPTADTPVTGLISALAGAVLGYGLSLWKIRLQPWVTTLGISYSLWGGEEIVVPEGLRSLIARSWVAASKQPSMNSRAQYLMEAREEADEWVSTTAQARNRLDPLIVRLRGAATVTDRVSAIEDSIGLVALQRPLVYAAITGRVSIPEHDTTAPQLLQYDYVQGDKGGRFRFPLQTTELYLGRGLDAMPYAPERLAPILELISRLETDKLATLIENLLPSWTSQLEINENILAKTAEVLDEAKHWRCSLSIANFGAQPMAVFHDSVRLVIRKRAKRLLSANYEIPCKLMQVSDDGSLEEQKEVVIVESGGRLRISAITPTVRELAEGGLLDALFANGQAEAYVEMKIRGQEIPWRRSARSAKVPFRRS